MDVAFASLGLVVLVPIVPLIAAAIKLDSRGPVLFRHERVGRGGRLFRMLKFRSMIESAPRVGDALTVHDDARITRVGAFLRHTKLDELPQLINVIRGDMSLVGPRPEVPKFMILYTPAQQKVILSLRPGLTDYASILFRDESRLLDGTRDPIAAYCNEIMPLKWTCYERYSREIGLLTDLKILAVTLWVLLFNRLPTNFGRDRDLRKGPPPEHCDSNL
jgi:lipopolysaccharide/colanic/teichoic acid biosynthesis glycosyltransferase